MNRANEPAFPTQDEYDSRKGLTIREHLAGMAMAAMCTPACEIDDPGDWNYPIIATCAVKAADALLAELAKGDGK